MVAPSNPSNPSSPAWLRPIVAPMIGAYGEALAMALFINILALATPLFTMQVYDRVVGFGGVVTLYGLLVGMGVVLVFDLVLRIARARLLQRVALRVDVGVGRRLLDKVLSLPLRSLERQPANHWQTLFRDVENLRNALSGHAATLIIDLPFAILFVAISFVLAPPIAWLMPVILAVFLLLAWFSGLNLEAAGGLERKMNFDRDTFVAEMVHSRTAIKALHLDERMRRMWEERQAAAIARSIDRGGRNDAYQAVGQSLALVATVAMTALGALAIIDQRLSMGAL
ncbi:MAG: peptidase domain-containing ABC transporter, partial [Alphaproteobacteria bacterium]|nr:peptidase domain-containing ABC transporter [Alphaproteobacteria bacterium]